MREYAPENLNIRSDLYLLLRNAQPRPWQMDGLWICDAAGDPVADMSVVGDARSPESRALMGQLICLLVNRGPDVIRGLDLVVDMVGQEFRSLLADDSVAIGSEANAVEAFRRLRGLIWSTLSQDTADNTSEIDWVWLRGIVAAWRGALEREGDAEGRARQAGDEADRAAERAQEYLEIAMAHLGLDSPAEEHPKFGQDPQPVSVRELDAAGWALKGRLYAALTGTAYADPQIVQQPGWVSHPVREMGWAGLIDLAASLWKERAEPDPEPDSLAPILRTIRSWGPAFLEPSNEMLRAYRDDTLSPDDRLKLGVVLSLRPDLLICMEELTRAETSEGKAAIEATVTQINEKLEAKKAKAKTKV